MRKGNRIYGIITVLLLSLGACSLIHDDMEELGYREDGSAYAYVSLTIHTGTTGNVTRSNPTGGEDGDGYEKGQDYENSVNNLTLFFYPAASGIVSGVNQDDVDFTAKVHISQIEASTDGIQPIDKTFTVGPVKVEGLKTNQQYHVLAVANAGDLADPKKEIVRLDDLRKAEINQVYAFSEQEGYSNFVMASEGDEHPELEISYENSEINPATTTINLERLVARVDYRAQGSDEQDGVYEVSSAPGLNSVEGKAKITGAMLMNVLDDGAPSWLLKRVADSWGSTDVEYLGKEKADANGAASNYVIDAISSKTKDDFVQDTYFKNFNYTDLAWESQFIEGSLIEKLDDDYNCIGYPKENVNLQGDKGLTTGVVFRAQYTPKGMTEGQTFFEWDGTVYSTLEALMEGFNQDNWDRYIKNNTSEWWSDVRTWEDLQTKIINQLRDDPVGYRAFLASEYAKIEAASLSDNISEDDKTRLLWDNYLKSECKYIVDDDKDVAVDSGDGTVSGTTRRVLHETSDGQIRTFKEGICYYTYWIKHANDQNKENDLVGLKDNTGGVMEYAIVRNNVYKLNVTSISGPGGDIPGDRNVNVNVLVEDWQMDPGEDIDLEPKSEDEQK